LPDISVEAEELVQAYTANEVAADQRYKGKLLEVSGTVDIIGKDILNTPYITFRPDKTSFTGVQAMFSKGDEDQLAALKKGDQVRVKCRGRGKMMNVLMDSCALVR